MKIFICLSSIILTTLTNNILITIVTQYFLMQAFYTLYHNLHKNLKYINKQIKDLHLYVYSCAQQNSHSFRYTVSIKDSRHCQLNSTCRFYLKFFFVTIKDFRHFQLNSTCRFYLNGYNCSNKFAQIL